MTSRTAIQAADWLAVVLAPQPDWAIRLEAALRKAAARRGRARLHFTTLIDRESAREFGKCRELAAVTRTGGPAVIQMMEACRGRRGRRPLSLRQQERRETGTFMVENRHRQRVARQARYERALREWQEKHGSLLGSAATDVSDIPMK
jgi:hypothetical protein